MGPFDYAVGLISILVGLALADVGGSLHKLLRQGRAVRWDGRVILSVTLVISVITGMWFSVWDLRTVNAVLWYPFYLTLFLEFMVLFLVCAACLPDDAVEDRDLGAFYEKNRSTCGRCSRCSRLLSLFTRCIFEAMSPTRPRWDTVLCSPQQQFARRSSSTCCLPSSAPGGSITRLW